MSSAAITAALVDIEAARARQDAAQAATAAAHAARLASAAEAARAAEAAAEAERAAVAAEAAEVLEIDAAQAAIADAEARIRAANASAPPAPAPGPPPAPEPVPLLPNVSVRLTWVDQDLGDANTASANLRDADLHERRGDWGHYRQQVGALSVRFWYRDQGGEQDYRVSVEPGRHGVRLRYEVKDESGVRASGEADFPANTAQALSMPLRVSGGETPFTPQPAAWPDVPPYHAELTEAYLAALPQDYSVGMLGRYPASMGTVGYHESIGINMAVDAAYFASNDPRALRSMVVHAEAAGRYGIFLRDEAGEMLDFKKHHDWTLDSGTGRGVVNIPRPTGILPPQYKVSHCPSLAFAAWKVTGWPWLGEVVRFQCRYNHFMNRVAARQGDEGLLLTNVAPNATRGAAWAWRTLRNAVLVAGLDSPEAAVLQHNADYYHAKYIAQAHNPYGVTHPYSDSTAGDDEWHAAWWMEDFFASIVCMTHASFPGNQKLEEFAHWKTRWVVGRLGDPNDPESFSYLDAAQYSDVVAFGDAADKEIDWENGTGPWPVSWRSIWDAVTDGRFSRDDTKLLRGDGSAKPTGGTGYWANLMPAITCARLIGASGAEAAWSRLSSANNFDAIAKGFSTSPVWAVIANGEDMTLALNLLASNALRRVRAVSPQDTSWVPALGEVADVSLNTLSACRGASNSKVVGVTQAWSGMAYAPWWGALGSFIHAGGGHDDGEDNAIWRYDIALRTFTKIKDHAESFYIDGYNADETTGWMWADTGGVNLQEGEPFTSHFYAYLIAIPPEALAGAPDGWLFTPGRGAMPDGGQRGTTQAHKWALGTSELWTMHGDPVPRRPGHGCTLYDTSRNRVITLAESQESATTSHVWFDFDTGESGDYTTLSGVRGHYMIGAYHQAADCYMGIRHATSGGVNTLTFKVITASTGAVTTPTPAGTPPSELSEGAWDWIEAWNAWVYYPGNGSNNIYTLTCDGDPRSGTWTWDVQTVTGTVRAVTGAGGIPYNRLRACQQLTTAEEAVLLWVSKYDAPAQAIKISR